MFDAAAFRIFVLCHEYDDLGCVQQPTAETRQRMSDIRWEMWVGVENIHTAYREFEVVSSCICALLCSVSGEEPFIEDQFEIVRQEVGV